MITTNFYHHCKQLGLILVCGFFLLTATACQSAADTTVEKATSPSSAPRSLWVWDVGVVTTASEQKAFLDFCSNHSIGTVFLDLGDFDNQEKLPEEHRKHLTAQQLGDFLETAHAANIKVEGLGGDPQFALTARHQYALDQMKKVLDYNKDAAPERRLDGFQWDVEPYILKEFKTDQHDSILQQYLTFVNAATKMVQTHSADEQFALGFAVPFWFDKDEQNAKWQDKTQPAVFHVLDILAQIPNSYIAIMAYRDKAEGANGSIGVSQKEMDYANTNTPNVGIWVGLETGKVEPASISFYGKTNDDLEKSIGEIENAFQSDKPFRGVAIHHWKSYQELVKP